MFTLAIGLPWLKLQAEHSCPLDPTAYCSDSETCCTASPGDTWCCTNTSVPAGPCCLDGCCTQAEECCADNTGAVCCIQQDSYCVPKDINYPARCCPRWTVGCVSGSVGCCDPAQPWDWTINSLQSPGAFRGGHAVLKRDSDSPALSTRRSARSSVPLAFAGNGSQPLASVAYILFETGGAGLEALTVDAVSGAILNRVRVSGLDDNPADETTREFVWDSGRLQFYYLDANFTAGGGARPTSGREIYLYTVDAISGKGSKQTVRGAVDYPVGQVLVGGNIIMACQGFNSNGVFYGYNYYSLDTTTAQATPLGFSPRGSDESDPGYYAGYHRVASKDGLTLYRLGYKYVTSQSEQGLNAVDLNDPTSVQVTWTDELSPLHDFYMTCDRYDLPTGPAFVSLAPSLTDTKRGLDIVQWSLAAGGADAQVLATLGNAHPPSISHLGDLGYLATILQGSQYLALVVQDGSLPALDNWALASLDLTSGDVSVVPLSPLALAGTMDVAGLGLPAN